MTAEEHAQRIRDALTALAEQDKSAGALYGFGMDALASLDALLAMLEGKQRAFLDRIKEAEEIDARHGFRLPGDSAIYIALWAMEEEAALTTSNRGAVAPKDFSGGGGA